jgi:large subunit ribosomal protein L20
MRSLWIVRISAAAKALGTSYSRLIDRLHKASVDIDRKMLSEMATNDPQGFAAMVERFKTA